MPSSPEPRIWRKAKRKKLFLTHVFFALCLNMSSDLNRTTAISGKSCPGGPGGPWTPLSCLLAATPPLFQMSRGSLADPPPSSRSLCDTCLVARFTVYASLWIMIDQMVETSHSACAIAVTVVPLWHHCPLLFKKHKNKTTTKSSTKGKSKDVLQAVCWCVFVDDGVSLCVWTFWSGLGQHANTRLYHARKNSGKEKRWNHRGWWEEDTAALQQQYKWKCCLVTLIKSRLFNLKKKNTDISRP